MASWRDVARMSPAGDVPESVRKRTGMLGCLNDKSRQTSGLKLEKMMLRLLARVGEKGQQFAEMKALVDGATKTVHHGE